MSESIVEPSMVERVALAIIEALKKSPPGALYDYGEGYIPYVIDGDGVEYVQIDGSFDIAAVARAAIEAMREPTGAILALSDSMGGNELCDNANRAVMQRVWEHSIDAALSGK